MKTLLSICLLATGLNAFAAGYSSLAVKVCGEKATATVQDVLEWDKASDPAILENKVSNVEASQVVADDNGAEVELKIKVTGYTLDDHQDEQNSFFYFDATYNSVSGECYLGYRENDYEQVWCESNCIK